MSTILSSRRSLATSRALPIAIAFAAIASILGNILIALIAHSSGVSEDFPPLNIAIFGAFTVLGVVAGGIGWSTIRNRAARPAAVLRWLVPTVLLVSFIPDILVGLTAALPGSSWGGVLALAAMHVVVAAAGVTSYQRFMPVAA